MNNNFRHGIISYPSSSGVQRFLKRSGNKIHLYASILDPLTYTIAHGGSNYLCAQTSNVQDAWEINTPIAWIYVEINRTTGQRTFGVTTHQPIITNVAPPSPVEEDEFEKGQMWYDTSTFRNYEFNGLRWNEVIRIIFSQVEGMVFTSVSINSPNSFAGTQIGILGDAQVGRIVFNESGRPLVMSSGEFFTTATLAFVTDGEILPVQLDTAVLPVILDQNIGEYTVLKLQIDGIASPATPSDIGRSMLVISPASGQVGTLVNTLLQGVITNPNWNWSTIGAPLWIDQHGEISDIDPSHNQAYVTESIPALGKVLSKNQILFLQTPVVVNVESGGGTVKSVNGNLPDASGDVQVYIPYKTSELTNDSGFITAADIPSQVVDNIQGVPVTPDLPTQGEILQFNGTEYRPVLLSVDDLAPAFSFSAVSVGPTVVESGEIVTNPTFNLTFSRNPSNVSLTVGSNMYDVGNVPSYEVEDSFTGVHGVTTSFKFVANTSSVSKTSTPTIQWRSKLFNGSGEANAQIDSTFLQTLNSTLASTRIGTFTVTAGPKQYIYFISKVSLGEPVFFVGGFEGGFTLVESNVSITNQHGITDLYNVYRSIQPNLGNTTVEVR